MTFVSSGLRSTLYQQSEVPHLGLGPVQPSGCLAPVVRRVIEAVADAEARTLVSSTFSSGRMGAVGTTIHDCRHEVITLQPFVRNPLFGTLQPFVRKFLPAK